jgi:hypothetical protein
LLWWAVGLAAAVGAEALMPGPLRSALGLVALDPKLVHAAVALALVPAATAEVQKTWHRRVSRAPHEP